MVRRRLSSVRSFFQSSAATFLDFAHQGAQSRLNLEAHCSRCTLHPPQTTCIARIARNACIACNPCNDCNDDDPSKSQRTFKPSHSNYVFADWNPAFNTKVRKLQTTKQQ